MKVYIAQFRQFLLQIILGISYALPRKKLGLMLFLRRYLIKSQAEISFDKRLPKEHFLLRTGTKEFQLRGSESSDLDIFIQIFGFLEYDPLCRFLNYFVGTEAKIGFVDGGANVGLASAFVSHHVRNTFIIGVEPDGANAQLARINGEYHVFHEKALGSLVGGRVSLSTPTDVSAECRITTVSDEMGAVEVITLGEIVNELKAAHTTFNVLKLDVEGAEFDILQNADSQVLSFFDVMLVEIHGAASPEQVLIRKVCELGFFPFPTGEYWLFFRVASLNSGSFIVSQSRGDDFHDV